MIGIFDTISNFILVSLDLAEEIKCLQEPRWQFNCTGLNLNYIPKFPPDTKVIILSENNIKVVNDSFVGLTNIHYLWMNKNSLEIFYLSNISATSMRRLLFLDLSDNILHVTSFTTQFQIPSLQGLAIHDNVYVEYPEAFISSMVNLQNLSIDLFTGFKFGSGILQLRNLSRLDFYPRRGGTFYFHSDSFLELSNTTITNLIIPYMDYVSASCVDIGVFSPFHHLRRFSFTAEYTCNIRHVLRALYGLKGLQMEYLNLANNINLKYEPLALDDVDIQYLSTICVKRVDLSNTRISKLSSKIGDSRFAQCLEDIVIGHKFFRGIDILPVMLMLSYKNIRNLDFSSNMQTLHAQQDAISNGRTISWNRTLSNRPINITIIFPDSLRTINLSWSVSLSQIWKPTGINFCFVGKGLEIWDLAYTGLPICQKHRHFTFLTSMRNMNLSGMQCSELSATFLSSLKTLQTLTFQDSELSQGLKNDPGGIFLKGLLNLSYLDLGNNELTNLHDNLFQDQITSLRYLYLHDNLLSNIPKAIQNAKKLEFLDIRNNKLLTLSETDTQILDAINGALIRISRNPFECSCQNLHMVKWLIQSKNRIEDYDDIYCSGGISLKSLAIYERRFELNCLSTFWLEFSASLCVVLILSIIISVIGYRHRQYIEHLFKKHFRKDEREYEFDGFISHSHHDADWVSGILYKQLVNMGMKISLYQKDFDVGTYIADEIARFIDNSRKIIFVVTRAFLESNWANYELEVAIARVCHSRRSGLLLIMKDDIPDDEMPDILRTVWWKVVCLKWHDNQTHEDQDRFWHKLKQAMETTHDLPTDNRIDE